MTLDKNSRYRVCPVCLWEDDGQADPDADQVRNGFNSVSLTQARFNFIVFGAYDEMSIPFARRPTPNEQP
jgi:cysteine-rich CPCC protein